MRRHATSTRRTSDGSGPSERLAPVAEDGGEAEAEAEAEAETEIELSPARPATRAPPPPPGKARSPPWYKRGPKWLRLMEESLGA